MKNLEWKLRKLPLVTPSRDLDDRVLAQKPERPMQPFHKPWRVPAWATAALGVIMAGAGFIGGVAWRGEQRVPRRQPRAPVIIQVIYDSPSSRNPFDFTQASDIFPAGELKATIQTHKGV